ncbi:MAG: hypothetical protein CBC29_10175 [Methylococcaceae bacterium TMED69]|nr:MAG: hypothetical protein CBC29_10175 [Methylococcaceae bacterium TMED69]
MRRLFCSCGGELFFDSKTCVTCKSDVGFDIQTKRFECISNENKVRRCQNGVDYGVCNWLSAPNSATGLCYSCEFNRIIPDLSRSKNIEKWQILEAAKKRLLYSLLKLGIPCITKWSSDKYGFVFDFIEDQRTNPDISEEYVSTGYLGGIITINLNEADPVFRAQQKEATNEIYRTVLGHFRHESGHHFYNFIKYFPDLDLEYQKLFRGTCEVDYEDALKDFYTYGPKANWERNFITPYASAHHLEDWAETWSHYLIILDSLETAKEFGLINETLDQCDIYAKISRWQDITVGLNEINRSVGIEDNYPFVINHTTIKKLALIEELTQKLKSHLPDLAIY